MSDPNPINALRTTQHSGRSVPYTIVKSVISNDGTRIDVRSDALNDDDLVLIHMGAGAIENATKTAWLDTTWFGNADRFTYRVPFELRGRLAAGDLVWVADDSVEPYLCRITRLLDNGRSAQYEVVDDLT